MNDRPEPGSGKKAAFVAILVVAPLLLLVGLELASRAAIWAVYGVPGKSYGLFEADPVLGHFPAANAYSHQTTHNDWGFRNIEDVIAPKPAGALRIIAYGGSTTFTPELRTKETWPYQLEKRLRAADGNNRHQVLNGGVVIWSIGHLLERARREVPKLNPDMVIIYSGFNETANAGHLEVTGTTIDDLVAAGRYGVAAANYPASEWLQLHSILYKIVRHFYFQVIWGIESWFKSDSPPAAKVPAPNRPALVENYLMVLARMIELVRGAGGEPVFVIQAAREPIQGLEFSRVGAKTACRLGLRVLDAREAVAAYPGPVRDLFTSQIHYSAKGSTWLADYFYDRLFAQAGYSVCNRLD